MQIALVLLLLIKLNTFEDRMDMFTESAEQTSDSEPVVSQPPQSEPVVEQTGLDSQQLRRIVREELRASRYTSVLAPKNSTIGTNEPLVDEAEMQYQRDLVVEELEFLKEQDEVSTAEMERLMGDIAQLAPEARSELLKMFNQAINRGEIKGHL